jgi:cell division protein FtsB
MLNQTLFTEADATGNGDEIVSAAESREAEFLWTERVWRPAGTLAAVALTALLTWHVINGKHGLQVWEQKRAEDRQLAKEIDELQEENAQLRLHVKRLESDPNAIEHEARERLHYAKPGEVIYTLPPEPKPTAQPAAQTDRPTVLDVILRAGGGLLTRIAHVLGLGSSR